MAENKIVFNPQLNEYYDGYKTKEAYFDFLFRAIDDGAVNIGAYHNMDIMAPAIQFALTFPQTKGVTIYIDKNKINKMDKNGLWLIGGGYLSDEDYKEFCKRISAKYPDCDRALRLFEETCISHKNKKPA